MELGTHDGRFGFLIFLGAFVLLEALWLIFVRKSAYQWGHTAASFGVAALKRGADMLTGGIAAAILFWAYRHRIATIEIDSAGTLIVAFLAVEFAYYWHHRWAHQVRWLWATHGVHHTAPHMNLSVAGRLGWTGLLSGSVLFFAPLAYIGFHPAAIFLLLAASLFYQIWLHTELVPHLGPLEWVFNTPSNHRVHHGSNPEYLDRNFGGVLMIYDVLFGTYAREKPDTPVVYGVVEPMDSKNPFVISTYEWLRMARDVARARGIGQVLGFLFGRPGWRPQARPDGAPGKIEKMPGCGMDGPPPTSKG